ncbi:PEP-CTERM sorting domain-containing protein [Rubripirellula amarantea]|nr:PEP-CTERM sorting domain-containing protein [Rubripirellula amarantea]
MVASRVTPRRSRPELAVFTTLLAPVESRAIAYIELRETPMISARTCARNTGRYWPPLCVCLLMALSANSAIAALGEVGFQIKISEKEMILEHPDELDYKMFAMWDTAYQRIRNRSMPWIEVKNLDESTGNLTEFSMTIGDTDYNFSDAEYHTYAMQSNSTPDVNISSITSTGDLLTLTFGNGGLAPGQLVRFGVDLDPDPNIDGLFPHPDFRLVLFDMNDMDGSGVADNSIVTGLFVDPSNTSMTATASTQLDDYAVTGPQSQYFNQFVRPYGVMEGIDTFGATATTSSNIPEPSSVALVGMAMVGLAAGWYRRR